jgi:hypothetical protein
MGPGIPLLAFPPGKVDLSYLARISPPLRAKHVSRFLRFPLCIRIPKLSSCVSLLSGFPALNLNPLVPRIKVISDCPWWSRILWLRPSYHCHLSQRPSCVNLSWWTWLHLRLQPFVFRVWIWAQQMETVRKRFKTVWNGLYTVISRVSEVLTWSWQCSASGLLDNQIFLRLGPSLYFSSIYLWNSAQNGAYHSPRATKTLGNGRGVLWTWIQKWPSPRWNGLATLGVDDFRNQCY